MPSATRTGTGKALIRQAIKSYLGGAVGGVTGGATGGAVGEAAAGASTASEAAGAAASQAPGLMSNALNAFADLQSLPQIGPNLLMLGADKLTGGALTQANQARLRQAGNPEAAANYNLRDDLFNDRVSQAFLRLFDTAARGR